MCILSYKLFLTLLLVPNLVLCDDTRYEPNWESLDSRPLPTWYDEAKFGIFIHWGVYSVPSYSRAFGAEWFWYRWKENRTEFVEFMENNYPETFSYQEFAKDFTAEFFNASEWAEMFAKSGAKYVVLTSKHHEGFHLWPSKYGYSWNSVDLGPHRDIVGELSEAVRKEGLIFGAYHSLFEWFHPMYVSDKARNFTTNEFVQNKIFPEMQELVEKYNVSIFWSDGAHEAPASYWNSTDFLAWLYNDSPVKNEVVANDRWGASMSCHHGGVYTCRDRYNPGTLQAHKWENAMTVDKASWGYRRNAKLSDYFTAAELISQLVSTVSCGGNLLMNIGPTSYGIISPIYEERLLQMGQWLAINGEAIYGTTPWTSQNDTSTTGVWYTAKDKTVYAIALQWPQMDNTLTLGSVLDLFLDTATTVTLLGNEDEGNLEWAVVEDDVNIKFPDKNAVKSEWAWSLKIQTNVNT